jgi:hypothetical protein
MKVGTFRAPKARNYQPKAGGLLAFFDGLVISLPHCLIVTSAAPAPH